VAGPSRGGVLVEQHLPDLVAVAAGGVDLHFVGAGISGGEEGALTLLRSPLSSAAPRSVRSVCSRTRPVDAMIAPSRSSAASRRGAPTSPLIPTAAATRSRPVVSTAGV